MRRGDVLLVKLDPTLGTEIKKTSCLLYTSDAADE